MIFQRAMTGRTSLLLIPTFFGQETGNYYVLPIQSGEAFAGPTIVGKNENDRGRAKIVGPVVTPRGTFRKQKQRAFNSDWSDFSFTRTLSFFPLNKSESIDQDHRNRDISKESTLHFSRRAHQKAATLLLWKRKRRFENIATGFC